jgi:hypothetical protein
MNDWIDNPEILRLALAEQLEARKVDADRIEKLEAALRSVPKIVEFGFENYKGCVDIKITREVRLFVQKALEGKDD